MVADKAFNLATDSRKVYVSDIPIKGKSFVRVFLDSEGEGSWSIIDESNYQIIDDSLVFNTAPTGAYLVMQVATTPVELTNTPNDVSLVLALKDDIKALTSNISNIVSVSDNIPSVNIVGNSIEAVVDVAGDINKVVSVSDNIASVILNADNIVDIQNAYENAQVAITKAGEAEVSASLALGYKDTTLAYRDATLGYRDEAEGFRDEAEVSAGLALGYKDTTLSYRDATLGYRDEAEGFRDEAEAFALSINPSQFVNLTGNQTKDGILTFLKFPITPSSEPTSDYEVANRKFVIDNKAVDATSSVKGIDYKGLLAEYTVSGSAVTSINFSGLDINTHKSYRVEIETVSNGGSYILMFVNGDTTVTNYYSQQLATASATTSSQNNNTPRAGYQGTEDLSSLTNINITKATNGLVVFNSMSCGDRNEGFLFFGRKTATVANVTQLTFTQTGANGFGVGSKIRIYRGDV